MSIRQPAKRLQASRLRRRTTRIARSAQHARRSIMDQLRTQSHGLVLIARKGDAVMPEHCQQRVDLACAFPWAARLGMHESIPNHFRVAVSAAAPKLLINPPANHFSPL